MSTIRSAGRGWTLVEVIVASFVGMLLLTATYELMVPGLRSWAASNVRSHLRQNALAVLARVAHDVKMSSIDSLVVLPGKWTDPESGVEEEACAITLMSAFDDAAQLRQREDGTAIWQKYVVFYLDTARHELRIGERPLAYDATGSILYRLQQVVPDAARDRTIGRNVRGLGLETAIDPFSMDFVPSGDAAPVVRTNPVLLRLHLRDHLEDCRLETSVATLVVGDPTYAAPAP